jgi:hypothetical protein
MNRLIRMANLTVALSCFWLCVSCGSGSSSGPSGGPVNIICSTDPSQAVVRLSGVFPVKNAQDVMAPWSIEFRRYLAQSGNEGGIEVTCGPAGSKDAKAALQDMVDTLRGQNKQVIQTGWTYAGG